MPAACICSSTKFVLSSSDALRVDDHHIVRVADRALASSHTGQWGSYSTGAEEKCMKDVCNRCVIVAEKHVQSVDRHTRPGKFP